MKRIIKKLIPIIALFIAIDAHAIGFTYSDSVVCKGVSYKFKDTTMVPSGLTVVSREWTYGTYGSEILTVDSVFHTFVNAENLTVTLKITYSDASFFTYSKDFYVKNNPVANLTVSDTITCPGVLVKYVSNNTWGSSNIVDSVINFGEGLARDYRVDVGNVSDTHSYNNLGLFDITYKVTDFNKCTSTYSTKISIYNHPVVNFVPINPRCKDSNVIYENRSKNMNTFTSWEWRINDSLYNKNVLGEDSLVVGMPTRYYFDTFSIKHKHPFYTFYGKNPHISDVTLIGKNQWNCTGKITKPFNVDTTPILVISPTIDTTICYGESIKFTIKGADSLRYKDFKWGDEINGKFVVLFTPKNTFTYTVYGLSGQCPPIANDIKIRVVQPIETKIVLHPDHILLGNKSLVTLAVNNVYDSIRWDKAFDVDQTLTSYTTDTLFASPKRTTLYKVKVYYSMSRYVCVANDQAILRVDSTCVQDSLHIPTAFTPNSDDKNDVFYVKSFDLKNVMTFNIYNRWGDKVYHIENVAPNNKLFGWNGKLNNNGEDLPIGVYIYNISAQCKNDKILNFQGEITILR